jgi:hypothetical protein
MKDFWRRMHGSFSMGTGKIEIISGHYDLRITLGHRFDLNSAPPSFYLEMFAEVIGEDDLLAAVTEASYSSSSTSYAEGPVDDDTQMGILADPKRLIIRGPIGYKQLHQLEYWMRMRVRVQHGHDPVNVTFQPPPGYVDDTDTDVRAVRHEQAGRLEKKNYVGSVVCY